MSEIKALEELREYMSGHNGMNERIDKVEAEITERFVELPVDADGVLCKCGDEVHLTDEDERLMVCGYTVSYDGFVSLYCSKVKDGRRWFPTVMTYSSEVEHVKPRTLEDVLADFAAELHSDRIDSLDRRVERCAAKYADEIRELLGVGE